MTDRTPGGLCTCGHPNRIHGVLTEMPWCCYMDGDGHCANTAEFHIETLRPHGGPAGPNPYADSTDACVAHVGALLGWQPDAQDTAEITWRILQL